MIVYIYLSEISNICHEKNENFVRLIDSPFLNPEFFFDWSKDCFDIQAIRHLCTNQKHTGFGT